FHAPFVTSRMTGLPVTGMPGSEGNRLARFRPLRSVPAFSAEEPPCAENVYETSKLPFFDSAARIILTGGIEFNRKTLWKIPCISLAHDPARWRGARTLPRRASLLWNF